MKNRLIAFLIFSNFLIQDANGKTYLFKCISTDTTIARGTLISSRMVHDFMSEIYTDIVYRTVDLEGNRNIISLKNAIDETNPSENDILILYVISHGAGNGSSILPDLTLPDGSSASISELYSFCKKKFKHVTIIADCCHTGISASPMKNDVSSRQQMSESHKNSIRNLFANHSGFLLASSPGADACIDNNIIGGLFTYTFIDVLKDLHSNLTSWDTIMQSIRQQLENVDVKNFSHLSKVAKKNVKSMRPKYYCCPSTR
jgi:hypothetical protein